VVNGKQYWPLLWTMEPSRQARWMNEEKNQGGASANGTREEDVGFWPKFEIHQPHAE
jgi:hypothetical protein